MGCGGGLALALVTGCDDKPAGGAASGATTAAPAAAAAAAADSKEAVCKTFCERVLACNKKAAAELSKDLGASGSAGSDEDNKELQSLAAESCQTECGGYDDVRRKEIAACSGKSECGDYVKCLVPNGESCHVEAESTCIDYTGSRYASMWRLAKTACIASGAVSETKAEYRLGACPSADVVGSCVDTTVPKQDSKTRYYAKGPKKWTAESAKEECLIGEWEAAE